MDIRLLLHPSPSYGTAGYTGSGISCVLSTVTFKVMLVLPPPLALALSRTCWLQDIEINLVLGSDRFAVLSSQEYILVAR